MDRAGDDRPQPVELVETPGDGRRALPTVLPMGWRRRAWAFGVLSIGLCLLSALAAPAATSAERPAAVVVLGDSAAAGDGAGDYEPGTRGENGNWCHRSPHAFVHHTGLGG